MRRLTLITLLLLGCGDRTGPLPAHLASECMACTTEDAHLCLDGEDSDEDGLTDCDDPDCAWTPNCPWEGPEDTAIRCDDGLDNDDNGYTDCKDFACSSTSACRTEEQGDENTLEACTNGLDDDWNGYIDCNDWSCEAICQ